MGASRSRRPGGCRAPLVAAVGVSRCVISCAGWARGRATCRSRTAANCAAAHQPRPDRTAGTKGVRASSRRSKGPHQQGARGRRHRRGHCAGVPHLLDERRELAMRSSGRYRSAGTDGFLHTPQVCAQCRSCASLVSRRHTAAVRDAEHPGKYDGGLSHVQPSDRVRGRVAVGSQERGRQPAARAAIRRPLRTTRARPLQSWPLLAETRDGMTDTSWPTAFPCPACLECSGLAQKVESHHPGKILVDVRCKQCAHEWRLVRDIPTYAIRPKKDRRKRPRSIAPTVTSN